MTGVMSGFEWDVTFMFGAVVGAGGACVLLGLALWETRRITLRRLWRDWHHTETRR